MQGDALPLTVECALNEERRGTFSPRGSFDCLAASRLHSCLYGFWTQRGSFRYAISRDAWVGASPSKDASLEGTGLS